MANKIIATNRKAYYNYNIIEKYESGIVLKGSEVKSIKEGIGPFFVKHKLSIRGLFLSRFSSNVFSIIIFDIKYIRLFENDCG